MKTLKLLVILLIFTLVFSGCGVSNETDNGTLSPTEEAASLLPTATPAPTTVPESSDMPASIGLYYKDRDVRVRKRITDSYVSKWQEQKDVECFEVFLTDDSQVPWGSYGGVWSQYYKGQCRVGYFLNVFYKDGTQKFFRILKPEDTKAVWNSLEIYIYDDVNQTPGQWYSHLESDDFKDNTVCSSIKLTPAAEFDTIEKVELTAFTYKDMWYFTEDGQFLGSNSVTISVVNESI